MSIGAFDVAVSNVATATMSITILRPSPSALRHVSRLPLCRQPVRRFFQNPFGETAPQILQATKTLPYASIDLYNLVSDVESYPAFVPYCTNVEVLKWSEKDEHYKRAWPQEVKLSVGFKEGANESFISRLHCVPPVSEKGRAGVGIVEAISGDVKGTSLEQKHIAHHNVDAQSGETARAPAGPSSPLQMLRTQWTISSFPYKPAPGDSGNAEALEKKEMSDVHLKIEYKFNNKVYEMMSQAVSSVVADKMMDAFEKRAQDLLGKGSRG